jgi:hypothetical protein
MPYIGGYAGTSEIFMYATALIVVELGETGDG